MDNSNKSLPVLLTIGEGLKYTDMMVDFIFLEKTTGNFKRKAYRFFCNRCKEEVLWRKAYFTFKWCSCAIKCLPFLNQSDQ